jgi:broad specificity phosphatase PhoE
MQTGRIVQERLAIPVTVREALKEIQPQEKTEDILERAWPVFLEALQVQDEVDGPVVILTHGGVVHVLLLGLGMASDTAERYCVFEHHNLIATAGAWEVNSENGNGGWAAQMRFSPKISIGEGQPRASL